MNNKLRLCLVQFPHPRDERVAGKKWYIGKRHRRKFLQSFGTYVDMDGRRREDKLAFWGEWEPPSHEIKRWNEEDPLPLLLQQPFWCRDRPQGAQNTDPWVFGRCFRYSNCNQYKHGRPTFLQRLAPGSMILFGSTIGKKRKKFVLDTLFVVQDRKKYNPPGTPGTDEAFRVCVLEALAAETQAEFKLYSGVDYHQRNDFDGMYSFVPCHLANYRGARFPRPTIKLDCYIKPESKQSPRAVDLSMGLIQQLWLEIRKQVRDQHCLAGVRFQTPPLEEGSGDDSSGKSANSENAGTGACGRASPRKRRQRIC